MKSRTLCTLTLLGFTACLAQDVFMNITSNCTGYYYEDINAAFVDCYDTDGVLVSRQEEFFTSPLVKECHTAMVSDVMAIINKSPSDLGLTLQVTDSVTYCDYFEVGIGYEFSLFQSGIGLVFNETVVGGPRDLFYKTQNVTSGVLYWDWNELDVLINEFAQMNCSSNSVGGSPIPIGADVYLQLNLPFSDWNSSALNINNMSFDSWSKAQFKLWL